MRTTRGRTPVTVPRASASRSPVPRIRSACFSAKNRRDQHALGRPRRLDTREVRAEVRMNRPVAPIRLEPDRGGSRRCEARGEIGRFALAAWIRPRTSPRPRRAASMFQRAQRLHTGYRSGAVRAKHPALLILAEDRRTAAGRWRSHAHMRLRMLRAKAPPKRQHLQFGKALLTHSVGREIDAVYIGRHAPSIGWAYGCVSTISPFAPKQRTATRLSATVRSTGSTRRLCRGMRQECYLHPCLTI